MAIKFLRAITSLDLEEQILNTGALIALVGVFLPWAGGEWLGGESVTYVGFGFYTGYLGIVIFLLHLFVLSVTMLPMMGGPNFIRRRYRELVRFVATTQATILTLASLSVLTKTTLEFARMELRFGIYVTLIGSLVASLYSFLRYQEQHKREVHDLFHHPDDGLPIPEEFEEAVIHHPPPPPPPAPSPEEHRIHHATERVPAQQQQ